MKEFNEQEIKWLEERKAVNIKSLQKDGYQKYKITISERAYITINNSAYNNYYLCTIHLDKVEDIEQYGYSVIELINNCIKLLKARLYHINKWAENVFYFNVENKEEIEKYLLFTGNNIDLVNFFNEKENGWYIAEYGQNGVIMRNDIIYDPYILTPVPNNYVVYRKKGNNRIYSKSLEEFNNLICNTTKG